MSMEDAIHAHAAALNNLAEAIRAAFAGGVMPTTLAAATTVSPAVAESVKAAATEETKKARTKAEKAADKAPDAKGDAEPLKQDAEVEKAVEKVEAGAKKNAKDAPSPADTAAPDTSAPDAGSSDAGDEVVLDYVKDVRPVLLAAIKKAGKETVQDLIKTFGVDKADQIDPAQFADLMAKAAAL